MNYLFSDCSSLNELDLSNFTSNNLKNKICMFYNCNSLKKLICYDEVIMNKYYNKNLIIMFSKINN